MADTPPVVLSYRKLPREAKNKLLAISRRGEDRFVFAQRLSLYYWIGLAASTIWLIYLVISSQDALHESWMVWLLIGVTAVTVPVFLFCLSKIIFYFASPLKNKYIFSTDEFLVTRNDRVSVWNLRDVLTVVFNEDLKIIDVWIDNLQLSFKTPNTIDAESLAESFDAIKARAGQGFLANYAQPEYRYSHAMKPVFAAVLVVASVLLTIGISYGVNALNVRYDNNLSFERAVKYGTIKEFTDYKTRHPMGLHLDEINKKIGDIVAMQKSGYSPEAKKNVDAVAVDTFRKILDEVGNDVPKTIYVKINERFNLDEQVVAKMKKQTGLSISSYYSAFPPTKAESRKKFVLTNIRQVFSRFAQQGLIDIESADDAPDATPLINVDYSIDSYETYFTTFMSIGNSQSYYPGAKFTFDFNLKSADASKTFPTVFTDIPKEFNSGVFDPRDSANYGFNEVLFGTTCTSLEKNLEQKFGFSE